MRKSSQERFLGIFEQVPGNIAKDSWKHEIIYMAPNSQKESFQELLMEPDYLTRHKTQFPQCS